MNKETALKEAYDYHLSIVKAWNEAGKPDALKELEETQNKIYERLNELGITPDEYATYVKNKETPSKP